MSLLSSLLSDWGCPCVQLSRNKFQSFTVSFDLQTHYLGRVISTVIIKTLVIVYFVYVQSNFYHLVFLLHLMQSHKLATIKKWKTRFFNCGYYLKKKKKKPWWKWTRLLWAQWFYVKWIWQLASMHWLWASSTKCQTAIDGEERKKEKCEDLPGR